MSQTAQIAQIGGVPVLILKEGTSRTVGKEAQRNNIMAARAIADTVRTTLGPRGLDKMLVDSLGDITITNDGATILDEMEVQHPAAKMMVEVAKTQDDEVGDGTTTAVVLAGELLKKAEELIDKGIHPSIIVAGYKKSLARAQKILEGLAETTTPKDTSLLVKAAATSMNSKLVSGLRETLAELSVKAVKEITDERDGKFIADIDHIQVVKKKGGSMLDTSLIQGVILDKEVVHAGMPKRVENAKIALLDTALEVEKTEIDAEIRISDPNKMKGFLDEEENILREMVDKIASVGATVVVCQKGIDDVAQHFLAKKNILAVRRAKKSDMEKLARAAGGNIVSNLDDLSKKDIGEAGLVEERKIGEDRLVFVEQAKHPKAVSILIRGGLERVVDEAERSLHDALSVVSDIIEDGRVVAGGGSPEAEVAMKLRSYADEVGGREQLAVRAFADAMEAIPRTLADNAGHDPVDIMTELTAAHKEGKKTAGIEVFKGKVADMWKEGVIEPLAVKIQALKSAVEASSMILRIDDVIAASKLETPKGPKGGPGGGMGGMGGEDGGGEFD
jgi:archaeal chaperonin